MYICKNMNTGRIYESLFETRHEAENFAIEHHPMERIAVIETNSSVREVCKKEEK